MIIGRCGKSRSYKSSITMINDNIISQRDLYNHGPDDHKIVVERIIFNMKIRDVETT